MYYICRNQNPIKIDNMNHHRLLITVLSLSAMVLSRNNAEAATKIQSPDKNIEVRIDSNNINIHYGKDGNARKLFTVSSPGVTIDDSLNRIDKWTVTSSSPTRNISYDMTGGKRLGCSNTYNEYRLVAGNNRPAMTLRLYNDGIAFRYDTDGRGKICGETTLYKIPAQCKRWMQQYNDSYESFFPEETGDAQQASHWGYPALFEFGENSWALLTEAGIEKCHSASSLTAAETPSVYNITWGSQARCDQTPWRVIILGSLNDIVESTLVTDVSPESRIADTSWIKPGAASWIYWAYNRGSKDYRLVTQYIDMARTLNLPYVLIDWEWDVMGNGGDINDALKYAAERNVKALLWYNSSTAWTTNGAGGPLFRLNKPEDREREFAMLQDMGVAGVKIDFFAGDTQPTMEYCIELLECAARHNLLANFHGATVPRGWQRTYPNLVSVEGVYGAEWYNNAPLLTDRAAAHNATLPFTRNVIGPMDYTPCTFSDSQHPHITTHGHELALTVLFESTVQHLADKPESYLAQPQAVQEFLTGLPTVWDDTKLLAGYPGKYVVMARKNGDRWFIAGINGTDSDLDISIPIDRIGITADTKARLYTDSGNAEAPWAVSNVTSVPEKLSLLPRGGFVMVL